MFHSPEEFQKRHWVRTCAVQCSPQQPVIDGAIFCYSKTQKFFSHILFQDKLAVRNNKAALNDITDRNPSIALHTPGRPYIAILFDVGVDANAGVKATWGVATKDDRCLRIHVKGFAKTMYPFADKIGGLRAILDDLRFRDRKPPPSPWPELRAKASWGHYSDRPHLYWERNDRQNMPRISQV